MPANTPAPAGIRSSLPRSRASAGYTAIQTMRFANIRRKAAEDWSYLGQIVVIERTQFAVTTGLSPVKTSGPIIR
jgi:hypothetical protein